jgi:hypothetical protein
MKRGIFLDASIFDNKENEVIEKLNVKENLIKFEFPNGFAEIPLIEECRAMNALDVKNPDNFDLMYDITMQMLTGMPVFIYLDDGEHPKAEIARFIITGRYMNLRGIAVIDAYPVIVNWLVEMIAEYLSKKFPRSLKDIQAVVSEREERMKSSLQQTERNVITGGREPGQL